MEPPKTASAWASRPQERPDGNPVRSMGQAWSHRGGGGVENTTRPTASCDSMPSAITTGAFTEGIAESAVKGIQ